MPTVDNVATNALLDLAAWEMITYTMRAGILLLVHKQEQTRIVLIVEIAAAPH